MGSGVDPYANALHYDWEYADVVSDIPFWEILVRRYVAGGGRVLDLCCGTLREGIPLARLGVYSGFMVVGVDISESMLERGKAKLFYEPAEVRGRMALITGDIRTMGVGHGSFDFALVAFNGFLHMMTEEDQLAALGNACRHLKPGGYFLADIFNPDVRRLAGAVFGKLVAEEKVSHDDERGRVLVRDAVTHYDGATQVLTVTFYYSTFELSGGRKLLERYRLPMALRIIFPGEWRLLLKRVGLSIVEEWGDYDFSPFRKGSLKMLFLCRKDD